jgi:peptidoglycan glycosyltransferase
MDEEAHRVDGGNRERWPQRPTSTVDDAGWRRSQRHRRRHLTFRGKASIAFLVGAALVAGFWSARLLVAGRPSPVSLPVQPPVATAPREPVPLRPPPRNVIERLPVSRAALDLRVIDAAGSDVGPASQQGIYGRLYETLPSPVPAEFWEEPLRVEYTFDAELTRAVFRKLEIGRVNLGNVVVLDTRTGRVLAYAATDVGQFPPTRNYPAASLVKVITAAAALDTAPEKANLPCRYRGSPYRLTPSRIDPPRSGNTVSLRRALATSNNQCFAQLAVHAVGQRPLMDAISRFGWLAVPAPAHAAGTADPGENRYDFGKLGCGLAGCRITPLHAAQLAAALANGELVSPRWIERVVDGRGRELPMAEPVSTRRIVSPEIAKTLREMLVDTTRSGTARRGFRKRNGRPLLGSVQVAGKTGSLTGKNPGGRYEWFIGTAPADAPRIAIAVVLVQSDLWWRNASQIAGDVLRVVFCTEGPCRAEGAERWIRPSVEATTVQIRGDIEGREASTGGEGSG